MFITYSLLLLMSPSSDWKKIVVHKTKNWPKICRISAEYLQIKICWFSVGLMTHNSEKSVKINCGNDVNDHTWTWGPHIFDCWHYFLFLIHGRTQEGLDPPKKFDRSESTAPPDPPGYVPVLIYNSNWWQNMKIGCSIFWYQF